MQVLVCTHFWNLAMNHEIPWKIMNMFVNSILLTEACCLLFASRCFQRSVKLASLRHLFAKDFVLVQPHSWWLNYEFLLGNPLRTINTGPSHHLRLQLWNFDWRSFPRHRLARYCSREGFFLLEQSQFPFPTKTLTERGSENVGNTGPNHNIP